MTPAQRRIRAQIAANTRWSQTTGPERAAATQPALTARYKQLAAKADPDGRMTPDELARAVQAAMRAEMGRLTGKRLAKEQAAKQSA